ncbi:MAG TPA: DNA replication/repair protein RecF [Anaerovoracaceae bacterium]|nr:DNA replication/repair protein RecF [Anaerovoracaceae bacterium]
MIIKSIKLDKYRNYLSLDLEFNNKINIFLGNNAQGKTNLLEAIYLCSMAKSFRTNNSGELVNFNSDSAKVVLNAKEEDINKKIEILINKNSKKNIKKDGKTINKTSELLDNVRVVIFSPDDLNIVKSDPSKRRDFINRELCQIKPKYYDALISYNKILKQKNYLLKNTNKDENVLDILDIQMANYGYIISKYRKAFCNELDYISKNLQLELTNKKEELKIEYKSNIDNLNKEEIYIKIVSNREKELEKRYSIIGPHRDDFDIFINNINVKKFGSQGQQRTCALTIKLSEIEIIKKEAGTAPILLLDDVLSELDNERQNLLVEKIKDIQLFITTTEIPKQYKDKKDIKIVNIKNGKIKDLE